MSIFDRFRPKPEQAKDEEPSPEELETRLPKIPNDFESELVKAGAKVLKQKRVVSDTRFKPGLESRENLNASIDQSVVLSPHVDFANTLRYAGFSVTEPGLISSFEISSYTPPQQKMTIRIRVDNPQNPKYYFTVKGPKADSGEIKKRLEYEAEIARPEKIINLFKKVDIEASSVIEKNRTTLEFNGCKIEIDELPISGFPRWAEIEGPSEEKIHETLAQIREITGYQGNAVAIGQTDFIGQELKRLKITGVVPKNIRFPKEK